jgi:hypothetical protein
MQPQRVEQEAEEIKARQNPSLLLPFGLVIVQVQGLLAAET